MKTLLEIDTQYMPDFLAGLLEIPNPTDFTQVAIDYTERALREFPFLEISRTRKGALVALWPG